MFWRLSSRDPPPTRNALEVLLPHRPEAGSYRVPRASPEQAGGNGGQSVPPRDMFTIGRSHSSFVFYDLAFLRKSIEPMFRILSLVREVRLYQNALVLERV